MGLISSPSSFVSQPTYPAQINLDHPLMKGAAYVFSMAGGISTVTTRKSQQLIGDTSGKIITPRGVGYASNTSYFYDDTPNAVQNSGNPHTIFGIWKQLINASSLSFGQGNNTTPNTIRLYSGGTPQYDVYLGGYRSLLADSAPAVGAVYSFAGVHTGSSQYTLLNGKRQSATSSFSGGGLGSPWTGFALSNAANAALIFGVIFNGVVPDSVISELWQSYEKVYFAPDEEIWIAPAGGSAGSSSGIASVSGIGASLSSQTGSIAGIAAASGVGASLFAGVGAAPGVAAVAGIGASNATGVGASNGIASASGVGSSVAAGSAVGAAAGIAAVSGVGASIATGIGSAYGSSSVNGVTGSAASSGGHYAGVAYTGKRPHKRDLVDRDREDIKRLIQEQLEETRAEITQAEVPQEVKQRARAVIKPYQKAESVDVQTLQQEVIRVRNMLHMWEQQVRREREEDEELLFMFH